MYLNNSGQRLCRLLSTFETESLVELFLQTRHRITFGRKIPNVAHILVFGCKCWYTLPKAKVKKLDARGKAAIFVGYAENAKAYKLIELDTGKAVSYTHLTLPTIYSV